MRSKPRFLPDMSRHAAPMQNLVEPLALALRASLLQEERSRISQGPLAATKRRVKQGERQAERGDAHEDRLDVGELLGLEANLVGVPRRLGAVRAVLGAAAGLDVEEGAELDLVGRVVEAVDRSLQRSMRTTQGHRQEGTRERESARRTGMRGSVGARSRGGEGRTARKMSSMRGVSYTCWMSSRVHCLAGRCCWSTADAKPRTADDDKRGAAPAATRGRAAAVRTVARMARGAAMLTSAKVVESSSRGTRRRRERTARRRLARKAANRLPLRDYNWSR